MSRVALRCGVLALLGCGPARGQPADRCTELPPLGEPELLQFAGPRGEGPCTGASGELCLTVREYGLASTEMMATGDVDGDGHVDAVLLESRDTAGVRGA